QCGERQAWGVDDGRGSRARGVPRPTGFFFQAEDGIRDRNVTGVQTCALPISAPTSTMRWSGGPAESFTWTIGKRPGQRAKYASGSCPPLVIQYRSTSSWTSLGSVSASSTSYGNFPSSGANSKS